MTQNLKGKLTVIASCAAIFLPGSLIFGFPGIVAHYWQNLFHVGKADIGLILFYVLAAVGTHMFLIGRLQEKCGQKLLLSIGALIGGASVIMAGYATSMKIVYLWAFLMGASSSFVYMPIITIVQLWYPQWRGLMSGLVSMFFGISGAVMSPVFMRMLNTLGYKSMTLSLGIATSMIGLLATLFIHLPETPNRPNPSSTPTRIKTISLSTLQSLKTKSFWLLWFTYAFAGAAGISMVPFAASFGVSKGLAISDAAFILISFNITNGISRFISGFLSDRINRKSIMCYTFFIAGAAYLIFPYLNHILIWSVLAGCIGFAFGTLFAVSAPLIVDCFGMTHFGSIFGLIFTAYGFISGMIGPWFGGYLLDITSGNFTIVFAYLGCLMIISGLMIRLTMPYTECSLSE